MAVFDPPRYDKLRRKCIALGCLAPYRLVGFRTFSVESEKVVMDGITPCDVVRKEDWLTVALGAGLSGILLLRYCS